LIENIARRISDGVDWIQIREKDLEMRELLVLARRVMTLAGAYGGRVRVLINSRMDVAFAAGADGIHLPSSAPSPQAFRRCARAPLMIGVSCHNREELVRAEAEGACSDRYSSRCRKRAAGRCWGSTALRRWSGKLGYR
jgi:thiamine-phosphate pyrophosphorylase